MQPHQNMAKLQELNVSIYVNINVDVNIKVSLVNILDFFYRQTQCAFDLKPLNVYSVDIVKREEDFITIVPLPVRNNPSCEYDKVVLRRFISTG